MPFIGNKAKKLNIPSTTFYGDESNTLSGSSTPATPASGLAEVWFDSSLKKWRIIYDDGVIESLGAGLSGAVAHKDTHKSGGSDPFAKTDVLNTAARYLETKSDPSSDSSAFWLAASGSDIKYWDAQGSPVKQTLERRALKGVANGYCDLDGSGLVPSSRIPTTVIQTNQANLWTEPQTIKKNATTLATLFRDLNTGGTVWQLAMDAKDSANNQTTYASFIGSIGDNTDGSEDGFAGIATMRNGVLTTNLVVGNLGELNFGQNLRALFQDTNLTALRTFTLSNLDGPIMVMGTKSGATVDINTTIAETDLLNYSVSANQIGANGFVRFEITGYLLQNQATGTTYTFKVKFGGTDMWADVSPSVAQSATKLPFRIIGKIFNKNATNAQGISGSIVVNDTTAATTGIGDISNDVILFSGNFDSEGADTTKDTTSSQTLQVTVTMSVSNAATHTVVKHKSVEVMT